MNVNKIQKYWDKYMEIIPFEVAIKWIRSIRLLSLQKKVNFEKIRIIN